MRVKAYLLQMFACMYENGKLVHMEGMADYEGKKIENVKRVLGFIQKNYGQRITNQDMAEVVQMNAQYFCRYFKRVTGKTPTEGSGIFIPYRPKNPGYCFGMRL